MGVSRRGILGLVVASISVLAMSLGREQTSPAPGRQNSLSAYLPTVGAETREVVGHLETVTVDGDWVIFGTAIVYGTVIVTGDTFVKPGGTLEIRKDGEVKT